jgi:hypothetical protein
MGNVAQTSEVLAIFPETACLRARLGIGGLRFRAAHVSKRFPFRRKAVPQL